MADREQGHAAGDTADDRPLDSEHRVQMGLVDALDHAVRQRRPAQRAGRDPGPVDHLHQRAFQLGAAV